MYTCIEIFRAIKELQNLNLVPLRLVLIEDLTATFERIDLFSFLRHSLVTWPEMGKQTKHSRWRHIET